MWSVCLCASACSVCLVCVPAPPGVFLPGVARTHMGHSRETGSRTPGEPDTQDSHTNHTPHKPNPLITNPPTDSRARTRTRTARVATNLRTTYPIKRGGGDGDAWRRRPDETGTPVCVPAPPGCLLFTGTYWYRSRVCPVCVPAPPVSFCRYSLFVGRHATATKLSTLLKS